MKTRILLIGGTLVFLTLCVSCSEAVREPVVVDNRPVSTVLLTEETEVPEFEGSTNADLYDYAMLLKEELRTCRTDKRTEKALVELKNDGGRQGNPEADR